MKQLYILLLLVSSGFWCHTQAQVTFAAGPASGSTQLVPYGSVCFGDNPTLISVCGFNATFQFTGVQCCPCPSSGMICLPGSVAYGGPGSSASFTNYHSLSYSPSNEHQRISFAQKITKFQWRTSGPAGPSEPFQIQVYDGGTLLGTFTFTVPGTGLNNTYNITAPQFDRLEFTEIAAISADDELMGDFRIATAGCPLGLDKLECDLAVVGPQKAKIHWVTENETDILHHTVLRSADGQIWEPIAEVPAVNKVGPNHFSYTDQQARIGINYYRVVSLGADGLETYSNIVDAQFVEQGTIDVVLYPNPAMDRLTVNFPGLDGKKEMTVVNQLGQVIARYSSEANAFEIPTKDFANAIYYLVITTPQGVTTEKFEVRQ